MNDSPIVPTESVALTVCAGREVGEASKRMRKRPRAERLLAEKLFAETCMTVEVGCLTN